eukprot:CAMPEP_0196674564 /NCGR_PEP_ID=MMETSP1090-20130531/3576_1 /TAXON_ID=37098 /ORGANISM="Isochrysis sp, Strain CCMP1244" /LENGTH=294 /DNA_ID=CAMNT_0042012371 /DNA_START=160 /DNA_END=1043 /DNA_ORIENTATION=+
MAAKAIAQVRVEARHPQEETLQHAGGEAEVARLPAGRQELAKQPHRLGDDRGELVGSIHLVHPPPHDDAHESRMRKDLADEGGDEVKALHRVERLRRAHAVPVNKLERVVPLPAERHALDHAEAAAAAQLALQLVALLDKPAAHLERERVALQPLAGCSHELEHAERLRRIGSLPQPPQELRPSRRQQVPEEVLAAPPGLESSLVALALPVQHRQVDELALYVGSEPRDGIAGGGSSASSPCSGSQTGVRSDGADSTRFSRPLPPRLGSTRFSAIWRTAALTTLSPSALRTIST